MTTTMQSGTWFPVPLSPSEVPIDQFTDDILNHDNAGHWLAILFHWVKVASGLCWEPADPNDKNAVKCCEGTVDHMTVANDGDICVYLTPDADCRSSLLDSPDKEKFMVCELPWGMRKDFAKALKKLKPKNGETPGTRVRICGYWIVDKGHEEDHRHELHPVTSILPRSG